MTPLTNAELDELARLEAGATPGEWFWIFDEAYESGGVEGADITVEDGQIAYRLATVTADTAQQSCHDRKFICLARNALPALLAELRLLRAMGDMMEQLHAADWHYALRPGVRNTFRTWLMWKDGAK